VNMIGGYISESESERKLLTYIRKVYSRVLSEIIENLFSMAVEGTERINIFPLVEQREVLNKLSNLREEIQSLTKKIKQNRLTNLQQQISQLQQQNSSLQEQLESALSNQKPEDLPIDWRKQLADKEKLEKEFKIIQANLSNEQQSHQQAESKIQQIELEKIQKQGEKNQIIKNLAEVIEEIKDGTSRKLERSGARIIVERTKKKT